MDKLHAPTISLAEIAKRSRGAKTSNEQRGIRALLNIAGGRIMRGHTVSIGADRLVVSVPSPIDCGSECAVFFGLTIADQIYAIVGTGRVTSCTGSDAEGYCAEMDFSVSDKKSRIAIEQLFSDNVSSRVQ